MTRARIIIVDDDQVFGEKLIRGLEGLYQIDLCQSEEAFREQFAVGKYSLIIMDMRLRQNREGLQLLKEVFDQDPTQAAIIMTAYADMESYADALESGALTFLDKREFSPTIIARTVEAIIQQSDLRKRMTALEKRLESVEPFEIIGADPKIVQVREQLRHVAEDGDMPVLITGEIGCGKKLVAQNIHHINRHRSDSAFVSAALSQWGIHTASIRLFGEQKTVDSNRIIESPGLVDQAKGGILLISGMEFLNNEGQANLLRLVESGYFTRVGGVHNVEANTQIVFVATSTRENPLSSGISQILVNRLGVVEVRVPSLRERPGDIPLLAQYVLQNLYRQGKTRARSIRGSALQFLESLPFPGNVRELNISVEYAAILADSHRTKEIGPEHLPINASDMSLYPSSTLSPFNYQLNIARAELALVEKVIEQFETVKKSDIASQLGYTNRFTFSRRIRRVFEVYPSLQGEYFRTANLFKGIKEKN